MQISQPRTDCICLLRVSKDIIHRIGQCCCSRMAQAWLEMIKLLTTASRSCSGKYGVIDGPDSSTLRKSMGSMCTTPGKVPRAPHIQSYSRIMPVKCMPRLGSCSSRSRSTHSNSGRRQCKYELGTASKGQHTKCKAKGMISLAGLWLSLAARILRRALPASDCSGHDHPVRCSVLAS